MIEIICVIATVIWFGKTAKEYKGNTLFWCVIGAISVYLPMFLMRLIIYPFIINRLGIEVDIMVRFIGFIVNLCSALLGVLLGKQIQDHFLNVDE